MPSAATFKHNKFLLFVDVRSENCLNKRFNYEKI